MAGRCSGKSTRVRGSLTARESGVTDKARLSLKSDPPRPIGGSARRREDLWFLVWAETLMNSSRWRASRGNIAHVLEVEPTVRAQGNRHVADELQVIAEGAGRRPERRGTSSRPTSVRRSASWSRTARMCRVPRRAGEFYRPAIEVDNLDWSTKTFLDRIESDLAR